MGVEDMVGGDDEEDAPVHDCELLGVLVRVAELLGVGVPVDMGAALDKLLGVPVRIVELLAVPVVLGVAGGLRVPEEGLLNV